MNKIGQCRVFADNYQFFVLDSIADPHANMPQWTDETVAQGFITNGNVLHISTRSHLNDHWIELWSSDSPPDPSDFDRTFETDLVLLSGRISIMGPVDEPDDVYHVEVPAGAYAVHVLTNNLGVDQFSTDEINKPDDRYMTDQEIQSRTDLGWYKLVLVPRST